MASRHSTTRSRLADAVGRHRARVEVLAMAESGRLSPIPLEFEPLDRINEVYARVKKGQVDGGVVITP